ncbi:PREDICTED: uncharacterized protein LOC105367565 [Ceratosolen solmsi marchali]|uniref:Uncharacterized protein LOC105367565 n=1 Tax=Ceratosolen solmsi marchali TaxID=326594 RepID=A0AAJ7E1Q2_9HYME|nr:PREDICTED: uncharacterized protein LOC105367565 [Ceratosolen solmsi marchali]
MNIHEDNDILVRENVNFEEMLLNDDEMKGYLNKLKESCDNFQAKIDRGILESISKSSECAKRVEKCSESIMQLANQRKELKSGLESCNLKKKVVEKKTICTIKEIERTKADIESIKGKKEKLSLDIIDLQQEYNKTIEYMKKQWDAVKKACFMYKNILDIHIDVSTIGDSEQITVTFFWTENPTDKKFFVVFTHRDDCWRVKKIEPELSAENKYQLNHIVQFSKQSEVANVTLLLCELRTLFIKDYFSA